MAPMYRQAHGPSPKTGQTSWAKVGNGNMIRIDLNDAMDRLNVTYAHIAANVREKAMRWSLNQLGGTLLTAVRQDLVRTTGAKYGRVMKVVHARPAHAYDLKYIIWASDRAMKLSDFGTPKPGTKNPRNRAWSKSRQYKGAFVIKFKGGVEIVKRVAKRTGAWGMGGRGKANGSGKIKVLYGPIIPREMIKPGNPSTQHISEAIPMRFPAVFAQKLDKVYADAKAAGGT